MTRSEAHRIWREALRASLARQRSGASEWLMAAWERETLYGAADSGRSTAPATAARAPRSLSAAAEQKRRWRSDPAHLEIERARAEQKRRAKGVRPIAEFRAELRAQSLATAQERREAAAERRRARRADPSVRERERDAVRARRAEMTVEDRRAEWARHQRAKRERDRLAREMSEAAE